MEEKSERGNRVSFMIHKSSKHSRSHSYRAPSKDGLGDATLASTTAGSFINSLITGVGTTSSTTHKHISFRRLEKSSSKRSGFAIKNSRSQSFRKCRQPSSSSKNESREQTLSKIIASKEFDKEYILRKRRNEVERKKTVIYKQHSTRIINLSKKRNILDENDIANKSIDRKELRKRIRMRLRSGINVEENE